MCGIAAIFAYSPDAPNVERDELIAIRDHMTLRGPDGCGEYTSPDHRVCLAHRRLAILDLTDAGAQPMWSADQRYAIVFNGEIYNFRALRSELQARGCLFRSGTDTEVLLQLYAKHGAGMVHHLRGMFAFALWDARDRTLFLARDPFGIKPLYYADDGRTIRIASQVKALLRSKHINTTPEPAGHVGFFVWGTVPDPFTLYRGIKALPAGHTLTIASGPQLSTLNLQPKLYCSIPELIGEASGGGQGAAPLAHSELSEALRDSVAHHLISDVPVGVFQSAGLDSSTLTAFAGASHPHVRTVTLGFNEYRNSANDEVPLAEAVAAACVTDHRTVWIGRRDFEESANALFEAMDQPSIDGVNTYFVSMAARRAGLTVALSGIGGDEMFGGYPSFRDVPRIVSAIAPWGDIKMLGSIFRHVAGPAIRRLSSPKYAGLLEYGNTYGGAYLLRRGMFMPWELPGLLDPDFVRQGWSCLNTLTALDSAAALAGSDLSTLSSQFSPRLRLCALELTFYMRHQLLRDADWAGMAHSLEIRAPLVDVALLRALAPALGSNHPPGKLDMARSVPAKLPRAVLSRPKTGFSVPVRDWLMQSFDPLAVRERGLRGWAREVYSRFADGVALHRATTHLARSRRLRSSSDPRVFADSDLCSVTSGLPALRTLLPVPSSPLANARPATALVLVTDAFGGFGGIAKFNRDFLSALCSDPNIDRVMALPRIMPEEPGPLPEKLVYVTEALGGKRRFMRAVLRTARQLRHDLRFPLSAPSSPLPAPSSPLLILCGHVNLLPAALLAQRICGGTVHLIVHGIDAWTPTPNLIANAATRAVDGFIAVSDVTKKRFKRWARLRVDQGMVLPNCVDLSAFAAGPKPQALLDRYALHGRKVLLTLGRLASEERYKGFDEVLEALPRLASTIPNLAYLIVGDGPDRKRLVAKAQRLGLEVRDFSSHARGTRPLPSGHSRVTSGRSPVVIFTGRIPESEKADHYRVADAYVMPSSGEGFGIVYLEALACGIPVIGSKADGSREALREGRLGELVDPRDPDDVDRTISRVLNRNGEYRPPSRDDNGLGYFSTENFHRRVHAITSAILGT